MDPKSRKADVESRLQQTAEAMSDRLASLQDEMSSTGDSVQKWIVQNPVKSVGGMLVAGLGVGLLFGGTGSRRRKEYTELIDTYLDALRAEVEEHVDEGEEPGPALDKALRDRVPLVVYSRTDQGDAEAAPDGWGRYFLQEGAQIIFTTGASLLVREAVQALLANVDMEGMIEDQLPEDFSGEDGLGAGGDDLSFGDEA